MFCHYALVPDESGRLGSLWLRHHVLLGDTIDAGQLFHALVFCLTSADDEDEALQEYFGGNRLREFAHSPRDGPQWSDHGDDGSNSGYIAYGGGFDGKVGVQIAYLAAYYTFLKQARLWELWQGAESNREDELSDQRQAA